MSQSVIDMWVRTSVGNFWSLGSKGRRWSCRGRINSEVRICPRTLNQWEGAIGSRTTRRTSWPILMARWSASTSEASEGEHPPLGQDQAGGECLLPSKPTVSTGVARLRTTVPDDSINSRNWSPHEIYCTFYSSTDVIFSPSVKFQYYSPASPSQAPASTIGCPSTKGTVHNP